LSESSPISPTAHYTGYVWYRNGLSHPALTTTEGRLLFEALHPLMATSAALGRPSLESYLLARHRAIDRLLERAIEREQITQVLEVAAGLSPRGLRFADRYGDRIAYIEADLPAMAARKRRALEAAGSLGERHEVRELDALRAGGPGSLAELAAELHPAAGLAVITEGLLGYLPLPDVRAIFRRVAATLSSFVRGRYISDLHIGGAQTIEVRAFRVLLSAFVRGRVHLHFSDTQRACSELLQDGFATVTIARATDVTGDPPARGASLAHILEASTLSSARGSIDDRSHALQ
jgi:O-methyltransferase involved in polyketide biosynthesis